MRTKTLVALFACVFGTNAFAEKFEGVRSSDAGCSVDVSEGRGAKTIELDYESNLLDSYLTSRPSYDVYHNAVTLSSKVVDAIEKKQIYSEVSLEDFPTVYSVGTNRHGNAVLKIQKQDRKAYAKHHEWLLDTTIHFGAGNFSISEVEQGAFQGPERADLNYEPFHILTLYCTL